MWFVVTFTTCSCLRAYGIGRDYIVLLSFLYVMGASPRYSLWAHPGNVTGVKSCEPGAYYVSFIFAVWEPSSPSPSWAVLHRSTGAQQYLRYIVMFCNDSFTSIRPFGFVCSLLGANWPNCMQQLVSDCVPMAPFS